MRESYGKAFSGSAIEKLWILFEIMMYRELRTEELYLLLSRLSFLSKECLVGVLEQDSELELHLTLLYGFASSSWILMASISFLVSSSCSEASLCSFLVLKMSPSMVIGIEAEPGPSVCARLVWCLCPVFLLCFPEGPGLEQS